MAPVIRPYRPEDRDAVYDVCVRTAAAGGDARGLWSTDDLMPDLFAGPYLHLEPELAFVLDDGGPVGYVLGTRDTAAFQEALRREWTPLVADKYRAPAPAAEADLLRILFEPVPTPGFPDHPAHLHIDLLPAYQRQGHGRALIRRFLTAVAEAGVPAVHLGMAPANTAARAFYDRLGFRELPVPDAGPVTYLGRPTAPLP